MQKIHTYTLLLIATLTPHLYPTQATQPETIQLALQLDQIKNQESFKNWQKPRQAKHKSAISQQVLDTYQLDIPSVIVDIIIDYILCIGAPYDYEFLQEMIEQPHTCKPNEVHALLIPGSFVKKNREKVNFHDFLILLELGLGKKLPNFLISKNSFINCYFRGFDHTQLDENLVLKNYGSNLRKCIFSNFKFKYFGFSNSSKIENCIIENTTVNTLEIKNSTVNKTIFHNVDHLDTIFESNSSSNKNFPRLILIQSATIAEDTAFDNCTLNASFLNATFKKVNFTKCTFPDIELCNCKFFSARFENGSFGQLRCKVVGCPSKMNRTTFEQCTFQNQRIKSAKFANTHFIDCKIDQQITKDQLKGAMIDQKTLEKSPHLKGLPLIPMITGLMAGLS